MAVVLLWLIRLAGHWALRVPDPHTVELLGSAAGNILHRYILPALLERPVSIWALKVLECFGCSLRVRGLCAPPLADGARLASHRLRLLLLQLRRGILRGHRRAAGAEGEGQRSHS